MRNLKNSQSAEFPLPSATKVVKGNYDDQVEEYLKQTIPGKDWLLGLKTKAMILIGQKKINGVYLSGNRLLEDPQLPSNQAVNSMKDYINDFPISLTGSPTLPFYPPQQNYIKSRYHPIFPEKMK